MEKNMKRILSLILVLSMVLGATLALTSCGAPDDEGAIIPVYLGEPIYDFDPTDVYADSNQDQLMSLLFEPLFKIDEKGKLEKAAAKKYKVDEDERTIVIEIRETYWSDGTRVKADDFVYAWRDVILNPNKPNQAAPLLYDIENALEVKNGTASIYDLKVEPSLYELTITYREGADYEQLLKNLASVATSPLRQDGVAQAPTYWAKNSNSIFTNGPFSLATLDYEDGVLELTRNLGYHQPPTKVDYDNEVNPYLVTTTFSVAGKKVEFTYDDIEDKTIFLMTDAPLDARAATVDEAEICYDLSTYSYVFNTENPLFARAEVRRALSLAVNRAAIITAITYGKAATGYLSPLATEDIAQSLIAAEANMTEAKRLLGEAGVSGGAFSITVNKDEESLKIAKIVEASWEELGFTVTVDAVSTVKTEVKDFATNETIEITDSAIQVLLKEAAYGNRDFDVIALDLQMYSRDAFVALAAFSSDMNGNGAIFKDSVTTPRQNIAGWANEEYDGYILAAYQATDEGERGEYLKKAEALLVNEAPVVPLVFNETVIVNHKHLKKISVDGAGNIVLTDAKLKNYKDYLPETED